MYMVPDSALCSVIISAYEVALANHNNVYLVCMRGMAEASHHSRFYQCIKKTGYLVKSPTSGKMGRWRKRWIMLVDSIVPCPNAGYERYARMEYYDVPENSRWCRDKTTKLSALKLKGTAVYKVASHRHKIRILNPQVMARVYMQISMN